MSTEPKVSTPLTDAVWRSVESKDWKESFTAMHDHAEALEKLLTAKTQEADKLLAALVYVDRQVREVWKAEDTYQKTHREWSIEQAEKALKPSADPKGENVP